ncbi:MAG: hypothetical protein QXO84_00780 [Candidatus Aenigmatarchaeota archaeon]
MKKFLILTIIFILILLNSSFSQDIDVTLYLNSSRIELDNGINVRGIVTENGEPQQSTVYVKVDDKIVCIIFTNSSGIYECSFSLNKVGKFQIFVTAITSSHAKTVSKEISTFISFGEKIKEVYCKQKAVLIQNIDGSIKFSKMKICIGE